MTIEILSSEFHTIQGAYLRDNIFEDTAFLCQSVNKQVGDIFSSPETVIAKLIQNIFEIRLQVICKSYMLFKRKLSRVHASFLNTFNSIQ